jgi:hypothetical protein
MIRDLSWVWIALVLSSGVASAQTPKWRCQVECVNPSVNLNLPAVGEMVKPSGFGINIPIEHSVKSKKPNAGSEIVGTRVCMAFGESGPLAAKNLKTKLESFQWANCKAQINQAVCFEPSGLAHALSTLIASFEEHRLNGDVQSLPALPLMQKNPEVESGQE